MSKDDGLSSENPETDLSKPICTRKVRTKVNRYLTPNSTAGLAPYEFTSKHIKCLEVFTKTLDEKLACAESGLTIQQIQRNEYMQNEINLIQEAASYKHRIKSAVGTHQRIMAKVEKAFDDTSDSKAKAGLASTLAKMSDTSLKVEGEFNDRSDVNAGAGIEIVLNIGGNQGTPPIDVDARVVDIEKEN